ncbi:DUF2961 domain-containing protein [Prolixibacteraceae bacterium JC049]|nr:DUF2961 domain-containing protein [Prolixibacteraceae bacterium JC049]
MRNLIKYALVILVILPAIANAQEKTITIQSLLREMVNRDKLATFPNPSYECKQASSYNRESVSPDKPGWFADSDGVFCIRTEMNNGQKEWVLMEDEGPGCITKIWAVCFYYGLKNTTGANVKFYLDGAKEPVIATNFFKLVKGEDFVKPPFAQESTRAGNLYFPIPYAKSCKITMDQKVFYNIINYRKYAKGTPVKTFTMSDFEASKQVQQEVAEQLNNKSVKKGNVIAKKEKLAKNEALTIKLPKKSNAVSSLVIKIKKAENIGQALRSTVLKATFDGEQTVWAPIGDFFNNVERSYPYEMWSRTVKEDGTMECRWVMPYKKSGVLELQNLNSQEVELAVEVQTKPWKWNKHSMHFCATWRMDEPYPTFPIFDWNFLEAEGKGVIVGDQWTVLNPREGWWGEGDEKIYVDNDFKRNFPSHFGTGTEDYYGWAGGVVPTPKDEFSQPFLGNVMVGNPRSMGYNVCSRVRSLDAIPFKNKIKFDVEASCGTRQRWHYLQYSQTTFWYALPGIKHNRKPLPEMAAMKVPTLKDLQDKVKAAKQKQYVVDGAIEGEILPIMKKSQGIVENFSKIPVWGELSSGAMKNIWFSELGDYVDIKLSEQFEKSKLILCAAVGKVNGRFNIYINGKKVTTQEFNSEHNGVTTPNVDLGSHEPVDNAYIVRFELAGRHKRAHQKEGKIALGIDFFLVQNNFLKR